MEVENEKHPSTFESDDLVTLVFERDEGLRRLSFNYVSVPNASCLRDQRSTNRMYSRDCS